MKDSEFWGAAGLGFLALSAIKDKQNQNRLARGERLAWGDRHFFLSTLVTGILILGGLIGFFIGTNFVCYAIRDVTGISADTIIWWVLGGEILLFAWVRYYLAERRNQPNKPAHPGADLSIIEGVRVSACTPNPWYHEGPVDAIVMSDGSPGHQCRSCGFTVAD